MSKAGPVSRVGAGPFLMPAGLGTSWVPQNAQNMRLRVRPGVFWGSRGVFWCLRAGIAPGKRGVVGARRVVAALTTAYFWRLGAAASARDGMGGVPAVPPNYWGA